MPKVKENQREFNARMRDTYKDVLIIDQSILYCKLCETKLNAKKIFQVKQHFDTALHLSKTKDRQIVTQRLISEFSDTKPGSNLSPIFMDICELFLANNIPLKKVGNPTMVRFLEKYTKNSAPSESTLRKNYVPVLYNKCIENLSEKAKDKHIWVSLDETTDVEQRLVANFVFGILGDESEREKCYLLNVKVLDAHNANTMATFFNDSLLMLYPEGIPYTKVLLVTSDSAGIMLKAMRDLRILYPNMLHVTCFTHGLHRLCEFIRDKFKEVNELISCVKLVYVKAPARRHAFKTKWPEIPLPPEPVTSRWGTWLIAAIYYADNFNVIHEAIIGLNNDKEGAIINAAKKVFATSANINKLKRDLTFIKTNFSFLIDAINTLQKSGLYLPDSIEIMEDVQNRIEAMDDFEYAQKLKKILQRNVGYTTVVEIANILKGKTTDCKNEYVERFSPSELAKFKYCPVTSSDVERVFSIYKHILSERRRGFKFENLKQHLIVNCNRLESDQDS